MLPNNPNFNTFKTDHGQKLPDDVDLLLFLFFLKNQFFKQQNVLIPEKKHLRLVEVIYID